MDLPSVAPVVTKLLEQGILVVILIYAVVALYKKVIEVQDKRVQDSLDREKTITIALQEVGDAMRAIRITLDNKHDKQ